MAPISPFSSTMLLLLPRIYLLQQCDALATDSTIRNIRSIEFINSIFSSLLSPEVSKSRQGTPVVRTPVLRKNIGCYSLPELLVRENCPSTLALFKKSFSSHAKVEVLTVPG